MSFFGITALGAQNPFQVHLINAIGLNAFTREEFKQAFDRIDTDRSGFIEVNEVANLLRQTYGMEPLDEEVEMFVEEFDNNRDGRISWDEFQAALENILGNLEEKAKKASEVRSYEEWTLRRRKHLRGEAEPTDKYKNPITFGQTYGFFDHGKARVMPTATTNAFNKKRCPETKYADSMISGGHHYT
jgi:hypothetical protein